MVKNLLYLLLIFVFTFSISTVKSQFYSGSQMSFGKNRIQYTKDRQWSYFRFNNFDTYYYVGSKSLAIYASAYADKQMHNIGKRIDYRPDNKIKFIVFKDLSDLKETNIGLITDEGYNLGGVAHVINNKVFVYFNGDHHDFEIQIKRGIAQVYLNELLYGGSIGSKIKNSILLAFPKWYTDGLISYLAENWNTDIDAVIRKGIKDESFKKFDKLSTIQQRNVGHSIWKFIELKYGQNSVADVLYMAKINRNIENGFIYVLGLSYEELMIEWFDYYYNRYKSNFNRFNPAENSVLKRNKAKRKYSQARISPDGKLLAYVSNEIGKVKVIIREIETGKERKVLKYGYKLNEKVEYHYPLLAWSPMGNSLAIIYEKKKDNYLIYYDYDERKKRVKVINQFDKVHDFSFNKRGNKLALSASRKGQNDIFILSVAGNSFKRITRDGYDDHFPRFVNNDNALIWSSNRIDDTLRIIKQNVHQIADDTIRGQRNHDLYFYNLIKPSKVLRRITSTPNANEKYAMPISYNKFSWLSNENGIYNRYIGQFDSSIWFIDTTTHYRYYTKYFAVSNYGSNILEQDYSINAGKYTEVIKDGEHTRLYIKDIIGFDNYDRLKLPNTAYASELVLRYKLKKAHLEAKQQLLEKIENGDTSQALKNEVNKLKPKKKKRFRVVTAATMNGKNTNTGININNYDFGNSKDADKSSKAVINASRKHAAQDRIKNAYNSLPYSVRYNVSQVISQVDFNYLNYSYQPFTNPKTPIYINNGFSALIKLGIMDLFEDYRLIGGVSISPNLRNNEYFLTFSNYKNRIDRDYTFHRMVVDGIGGDNELKTHYIHELFGKFGFPFDNIRSFRITLGLRNDNAVTKAVKTTGSLTAKDVMANNGILRIEYVFDNTRNGGINILYGARYKIFGEYYQPIEEYKKNLIVLGFDFRKYIQIHKTFVWANRLAGSSSLGTQRLIYYMGGVDNWMFASFNDHIQVNQEMDFAYQTLATNMRGFKQNIRNGNSFFLINSELRLPPFTYFSATPIKSVFWANFMLIGFFDVGTAWTGYNPFSDKNSLFRKSIYQNPVEVTIINQDDPIVAGYGMGIRSTVFGYYMRLDLAWSLINRIPSKKPILHFSLSLDF